jgi:hypothetical protein
MPAFSRANNLSFVFADKITSTGFAFAFRCLQCAFLSSPTRFTSRFSPIKQLIRYPYATVIAYTLRSISNRKRRPYLLSSLYRVLKRRKQSIRLCLAIRLKRNNKLFALLFPVNPSMLHHSAATAAAYASSPVCTPGLSNMIFRSLALTGMASDCDD